MHVYPQAYKLSCVYVKIGEERVSSLAIELFEDSITTQFLENLDRTSQNIAMGSKKGVSADINDKQSVFKVVSEFANQVSDRRQTFNKSLEKLVQKEHQVIPLIY